MPLFEIAILEVPTEKEIEEGTKDERLAFGPVFVVAKDGQSAALRAVLENTDKAAKIDRARMAVLVRPFNDALGAQYHAGLNYAAAVPGSNMYASAQLGGIR